MTTKLKDFFKKSRARQTKNKLNISPHYRLEITVKFVFVTVSVKTIIIRMTNFWTTV